MYWTTLGTSAAVYHSHMDGQNMRLMDDITVDYPTGITIDYFHDERLEALPFFV